MSESSRANVFYLLIDRLAAVVPHSLSRCDNSSIRCCCFCICVIVIEAGHCHQSASTNVAIRLMQVDLEYAIKMVMVR